MSVMPGRPGMGCPECGRPVPLQGAKLCPHCGYPLLLDRRPPVNEDVHKIAYKPTEWPNRPRTPDRPMPMPGTPVTWYGQPERMRVSGPQCSACRHVNPPNRKRCEVCGQELWPGAAAPTRWMPQPPAIASEPRRRRSWWKFALLIGIPLAAMGAVWLLALLL